MSIDKYLLYSFSELIVRAEKTSPALWKGVMHEEETIRRDSNFDGLESTGSWLSFVKLNHCIGIIAQAFCHWKLPYPMMDSA